MLPAVGFAATLSHSLYTNTALGTCIRCPDAKVGDNSLHLGLVIGVIDTK